MVRDFSIFDAAWDTDNGETQEAFYVAYTSLYGVDDTPMQWGIFQDRWYQDEGVEIAQYLDGH